MHPLIEANRNAIRTTAERRGIHHIRVFGSMARGTTDADSDVDLLVTLPPGVSGLAMGGLWLDLEELLHRRMQIVTEAGLHPALREKVLREALPL